MLCVLCLMSKCIIEKVMPITLKGNYYSLTCQEEIIHLNISVTFSMKKIHYWM